MSTTTFPDARYVAIWEQSAGPAWQARHGLSSANYQKTFDQLVAQGYRLVEVSGYEVGGDVLYAAIWEQRPGPAWQARHGLTGADYQKTFDELVAQGYRLVEVSGYAVGGDARYAAIWEQRPGPAWQARHGLTGADYQKTFDDLVAKGYRLIDVSGYTIGNEPRYAAIWEQSAGPAWQARHGLTGADYQKTFDDLVAKGYRLTEVSGYGVGGDPHFAAIWEQRPGPAWQARHGLSGVDYQLTFDELLAQGYRLVDVSGYSERILVAAHSVLTHHNDNARTGAYLHETTLTPARVTSSRFGRLYERHVNGDQLAQVLYVRHVPSTRLGTRNLFFAATSTNEVYAFDADDYSPDPNAGLVWKAGPLGPTRLLNDAEICRETIGSVGITSTPVIDVTTQTMYVVARHWANGGAPTPPGSADLAGTDYLHALELSDGTPRVPPQAVGGTDPRTGMTFDPTVQRNRPGLLFLNGVVYVGYGTFNCDGGIYLGWVFGFAADTLAPRAIFCTTRSSSNQWGAGVWQSGNGLVGSQDGHIYFETGNDIFAPQNDAQKASPLAPPELADAFVNLHVTPAWPGLELAGHFQPSNAQRLRDGDRDASFNPIGGHWGDTDLGSGGPILLPGNRLIGGGKQGRYYVIDPATMTLTQDQTSADPVHIGQGFQAFQNTWHPEFSEFDYGGAEGFGPNIHGGPVYWQGPSYVYQMSEKDHLKAYHYDQATGVVVHGTGPAATSVISAPDGMPGGHSSLSASDNQGGIVWTVFPTTNGQWVPVPATMHAFDGLTLSELWADLQEERFAKFNPPTIADGKVFRPVFSQYSYNDTQPGGSNPAPARVGPGKVVVYGLSHHIDRLPPPMQVRRWAGGSDPVPLSTIAELTQRLGGMAALAEPLGDELEIGDERSGRRRDFRAMVTNRSQRVPSRALLDGADPTCHKPPRRTVELQASIFWSEATGAHAVAGEIRDEYLRLGGPTGRLGYPVAPETDTADRRGRVSRFEGGEIVWDPDTGAEASLSE
jgi:hypothetical protein